MAADTAETATVKVPGRPNVCTVTPGAVQKLFAIDGMTGGVSCWGRGEINMEPTSDWLQRFMRERGNVGSLKGFADRLSSAASEDLRGQLDEEARIGFHVAGYESDGSGATFYHVHNGPSQYFQVADKRRVNAHHDCPPAKLKEIFDDRQIQEMRNGEFIPYAVIREAIGKALDELASNNGPSMLLTDLDLVVSYNVAEIRFMSDLYALFKKPVIGGKIHSLAITTAGVGPVIEHDNASGIKEAYSFDQPTDEGSAGAQSGGSGASGGSGGSGVSGTRYCPPPSGYTPQTNKTTSWRT